MADARAVIRYWSPVWAWAGMIFWGSTDALSSNNTSRFLRPLILWLAPALADETVNTLVLFLRKFAHSFEYAVLAGLFWRALYRPARNQPRPWSREFALAAWSLAVLYAITDEFHQSFSGSREGHPRDVAIDAIGALLGLTAIRVMGRWRKLW